MQENRTNLIGTGLKLLTIRELQAELGISRPTANRLLEKGLIKSVRVGRAIRIPVSSIQAFIDAGGERHLQCAEANKS